MSDKRKALIETVRGAFELALDAKKPTAASAALNLANVLRRPARHVQATALLKAA